VKKFAIFLGVVIVLILAVALAIPFLVDANQFRPALEDKLSRTLGREVKVADLKLSLLSGSVKASDLSIGDDPAFAKTPFLRASALKVGVELMPLILSRKLNVTGITMDKPDIDLIQNAEGVWNFSGLGGTSASRTATAKVAQAPPIPSQSGVPDFSIADFKISDGRVTMRRLGKKAKPVVLDTVAMEVKGFSQASSFPLMLTASLPAGGSLKLDGNAGPINQGAVIETPFNAKLAGSHLDLMTSGLVDPSTGVAGFATIDGSAKSEQAKVAIQGKVTVDQLKLAKGGMPAKRPVEMNFDVIQDLKKLVVTIRRADIHVGSAVASVTGSSRLQTEPATLDARLSGSKMPLTDLAALLPALDIVLPAGSSIEGGAADVNLVSQGPFDRLVTTGTIALEGAKLANFDLATKLKVIEALAGIQAGPHTTIQTLSANLKNSPSGTAVDNLQMVVPSIGEMTGAGTISPAHELDFRMRVNVHSALATTSSVGLKNDIPFTISGTSASPSFRPDVKGLATDQLKGLSGAAGPASGLIDSLFGGKKKQK